jgi:tripartite-type tricarboxylate transporter receptor subunit TctC
MKAPGFRTIIDLAGATRQNKRNHPCQYGHTFKARAKIKMNGDNMLNCCALPLRILSQVGSVVLCVLAISATAQGQTNYPNRPIRLIVPYSPGASLDTVARLVGQQLGERLRQTVIVENRPGAGALLGTDHVAKAKPDGYTLLLASNTFSTTGALNPNAPFDSVRDFALVSLMAAGAYVLVATPSLPANSLAELVTYAKARPGTLNYSTAGLGTGQHMVGELVKMRTGTDIVHVPYKGAGEAVLSTMSGETQLSTPGVATAFNYVQQGKLKPLGITSKARLPILPQVSTFKEQGIDFVSGIYYAIAAPSGTPKPIIQNLHKQISAILQDPAVYKKITSDGAEIINSTPEEFAAFLISDIELWREVVKKAGIKVEGTGSK